MTKRLSLVVGLGLFVGGCKDPYADLAKQDAAIRAEHAPKMAELKEKLEKARPGEQDAAAHSAWTDPGAAGRARQWERFEGGKHRHPRAGRRVLRSQPRGDRAVPFRRRMPSTRKACSIGRSRSTRRPHQRIGSPASPDCCEAATTLTARPRRCAALHGLVLVAPALPHGDRRAGAATRVRAKMTVDQCFT